MRKLVLTTAIAAAMTSTGAFADLTFNGFASITAGQTISSDEELYGYDDDINFKNESLFALQVTGNMADNLTATAQIVAKGDNDFDAEFEWAYVTYSLSDNAQISAGKLRIPFYRYSDFLDVGYAYRWVRPPQSVYNLPFSTYEGLSYLYNSTLGDWDSSLQILYGGFDGDIAAITSSDSTELNNIAGVNWTLSYDWFSARAAYLISEVSIDSSGSGDLSALIGGLNSFGLNDAISEILIDEDDGAFLGLGFTVDYNNFLLDVEYTEFEVDNSILAKQEQYYVSVGYRLDDITLHVTLENDKDSHADNRYNQVPTTFSHPVYGTLPLSVDPTNPSAPLLRDLVNGAFMSQENDRDTLTFGVRYDFHPSAALKVDYSTRDNNLTNSDASVLAVGIDLVF